MVSQKLHDITNAISASFDQMISFISLAFLGYSTLLFISWLTAMTNQTFSGEKLNQG